MASVASAILDTIPISQFNKGLAGKIFSEVKKSGPKVVMKNNTAECVLLSPEEYIRIMDLAEDARITVIAAKRMDHFDIKNTISAEDVYKEFGIDSVDTSNYDEVEFE